MKQTLLTLLILGSLTTSCSLSPTKVGNSKELDAECLKTAQDGWTRYVELEAILNNLEFTNWGYAKLSTDEELVIDIEGPYNFTFKKGTGENEAELLKPADGISDELDVDDYRVKTNDGKIVNYGSKVLVTAKMTHSGVKGRCKLEVQKIK